MVACAFCEIASGDASASIVFSDEHHLGFLDRSPLFAGHTLVVPRVHVETLADLPRELLGPLFERVARLQRVLEVALGAEGAFVAVNNRVSQSVPHLHVHVVPRSRGDGLKGFFWPRRPYRDDAHRDEVASRLAEEWQRQAGSAPDLHP